VVAQTVTPWDWRLQATWPLTQDIRGHGSTTNYKLFDGDVVNGEVAEMINSIIISNWGGRNSAIARACPNCPWETGTAHKADRAGD